MINSTSINIVSVLHFFILFLRTRYNDWLMKPWLVDETSTSRTQFWTKKAVEDMWV